ncbi:arp2/3 complex-activating protein rickA-like [Helianthus annuus]|uniref:arp2/3 complex-activating protein rickA-like n=1 Tax=Helianthus annuus TaxID=4232 RepID=UPI000B8F1862|nr:arp2/3 complex-activating protein rickA-like [Helianthus annuus]
MQYFNPLTLRTAENVFSAGVRGGTSVVPPIYQGHQSMSAEQLNKKLEDTTAVCTKKTATEEKLDLILEDQKSKKQTEDNTAALNKLQESSENRESSSEFKKALKELQDIKKQLAEVATAGESSSSGRILEEIQFLRVNNSSMAEAFEKLMVELTEQKNQENLEFQRMKKQEETNTQTLANVHLLVKRLQYNVARLSKVDLHELKAPIPQEKQARESETPQQQPETIQQDQTKQTETPTTQKQKLPMGPPPNKPKLLMGPPPNIPKPDTSRVQHKEPIPVQSSFTAITGETEFSIKMDTKEKRRMEHELKEKRAVKEQQEMKTESVVQNEKVESVAEKIEDAEKVTETEKVIEVVKTIEVEKIVEVIEPCLKCLEPCKECAAKDEMIAE